MNELNIRLTGFNRALLMKTAVPDFLTISSYVMCEWLLASVVCHGRCIWIINLVHFENHFNLLKVYSWLATYLYCGRGYLATYLYCGRGTFYKESYCFARSIFKIIFTEFFWKFNLLKNFLLYSVSQSSMTTFN